MAYPKKPHALRVLDGSRQPDDSNVVDMPLASGVPAAPDWLPNGHAIKEFNRLATILYNVKLLTDASVSALGQMCALHGKIVQLYAAGESPNASMVAQYRALANDFGLTPAAQGKVKAGAADDDKSNRFGKNGKR